VIGAAPFVAAQALLARGEDMKGTLVRGIDPALEGAVTDLAATNEETLKLLVPGEFRVVLGGELARAAGRACGRCGDADRARPGRSRPRAWCRASSR
jgi:lipoprotein-releasing system permease protein